MKSGSNPLQPSEDPVYYDIDLRLQGLYHPLGFSVEVATNSEQVLAAAHQSWGHFRKVFEEPPLHLRVAVLEGGADTSPPPPVTRGQRGLMIRVADAANFSVTNMELGFSTCWVSPATVADTGYLRYCFLEGMTWDLLGQFHLTPIHAACVGLKNKGVLLCGDTGAGKSSLSYACARRGWTFLSDDSTSLLRNSTRPIVVGNPFQIRFRDSAVTLFPELQNRKITRRINGKLSIELPTAEMPAIRTVTESSIDHIVFLKRGQSGPPRLVPFPKSEALPWFEKVICYREHSIREEQKASLLNLLNKQILELQYNDLDAAVELLDEMVNREGVLADVSRVPHESTHA